MTNQINIHLYQNGNYNEGKNVCIRNLGTDVYVHHIFLNYSFQFLKSFKNEKEMLVCKLEFSRDAVDYVMRIAYQIIAVDPPEISDDYVIDIIKLFDYLCPRELATYYFNYHCFSGLQKLLFNKVKKDGISLLTQINESNIPFLLDMINLRKNMSGGGLDSNLDSIKKCVYIGILNSVLKNNTKDLKIVFTEDIVIDMIKYCIEEE